MERKKSFKELFDEAQKHEDYWISELILNFTDDLYRAMKKKNIKKSELAKKLGTSAAYITKVLRGDANFTLKTMFRLANAVEENLEINLGGQKQEIRYVLIDFAQKLAATWPSTTAITTQDFYGYGEAATEAGVNIACTIQTGQGILNPFHPHQLRKVTGIGRAVPGIIGTAANETGFAQIGGR